jgi:hypothetical protein
MTRQMAIGGEHDDLTKQIDAEWDTYRRWIAAHSQGAESRPELPNQLAASKGSGWIGAPAMLILVGLSVPIRPVSWLRVRL